MNGYFSKSPIETYGNWKITSLIVLAEKGRLAEYFPELSRAYFSAWKIPETAGFGTDICFLGAREDVSKVNKNDYFRRFR